MKNVVREFALICVLVMMFPPTLSGQAEYTIKLGHIANDQNIWNKAALKFKEVVEKNSNGKIEVKVYPNEYRVSIPVLLINDLHSQPHSQKHQENKKS